MKSFMKSHRKSGSNPVEKEFKPPVTPKLNHSVSAFNLRQKTPTSSPTLHNSSAFTTSPLQPPPVPFGHKSVSPISSPSGNLSLEPTSNHKRSRLKGLLKHKTSKTSLNSSLSNPSSPVVASKSFVTFSDSNLTLPSQTPDFVVDRPIVSSLNIINEEKHNKEIFKNNNDSIISNLTVTSNEDLSLGNKLNYHTTASSTGLDSAVVVRAQSSVMNLMDSNSINKSQYSFQSSRAGVEASAEKDSDNQSQHSSDSSEFSFEANRTYGRSTSIKYYKKQEELEMEEAHIIGRKFIDDFIGEEVDVTDLHDDLNYDDSDLEDDTEDLFNRKLFSSDEEEENEQTFLEESKENDEFGDDDYLDEVNEDLSDYELIGGEVTEYRIDDDRSIESDNEDRISELSPRDLVLNQEEERLEEDLVPNIIAKQKSPNIKEEPNTVISENSEIEHSLFVNSVTKRMSQMTVDTPPSLRNQLLSNMGTTQKNRLGLSLRTNSVKYHQIPGKHDDDLKFLNARYSWYVNDEDALRIQQSLLNMEREAQVFSDISTRPSSGEFDSQFWGIPTSYSDKFDDSLLDEVNQMPEDFEFGSHELDLVPQTRKLSNSSKNKRTSAARLMAPSATTGTKFDRKDKTVTLFRSSSSRSKTVSFDSIDSFGEERGHVDQSDEDNFDFITPVASLEGQPHAAFNVQDSPLTTISEGSLDSNYSPKHC